MDLTGARFGRLIVLAPAERLGGRTTWLCRCDCGVEKAITGNGLRTGDTLSCGCLHREQLGEKNRIDLTGMRFHKLVALEPVGRRRQQVLWRCACDCGNEATVVVGSLRSGGTKSCGCQRAEANAEHNDRQRAERVQRLIRLTEETGDEDLPPQKIRALRVLANGGFGDWTRAGIYERDGGLCHLCGKVAARSTFHVDHILPLLYGGPDASWNVAVACLSCNVTKHTKHDALAGIDWCDQHLVHRPRRALLEIAVEAYGSPRGTVALAPCGCGVSG